MPTDFQLRVLASLRRDHGVNHELIARNLAGVIKGETITECFDGSGNLTSRKVTARPSDMAIGLAIYDKISGGELGLGRDIVGIGRTTREMYEEFRPMLAESNESVVYKPREVIEMDLADDEG